ncbi:pilus assembly protein [Xylanimonas allomyrinae]|uniref:Pilus assembly protein n=1 Tax=Xylanimonas allomyrinae TaxID=2509459 RepID=A0A4P6ESA2_9MICO|nr:pilus assembly protein [Xylanimonas allomyrinae]
MRGHDERGSSSVEAAIIIPAFVLFLGLVIFAGRTALAHQAVQAAAYDAARAASLERAPSVAQSAAADAAAQTLANRELRCSSTGVDVETSALGAPLGEYGTVTVEVTCVVDIGDLAVPGVPGSTTVTASMSSPVDAHRERP